MTPGNSRDFPMTFDVYGRRLVIEREAGAWRAYYSGPEGKRRPAEGIQIPSQLAPDEIESYLADVCHEWASPRHPVVGRLF